MKKLFLAMILHRIIYTESSNKLFEQSTACTSEKKTVEHLLALCDSFAFLLKIKYVRK